MSLPIKTDTKRELAIEAYALAHLLTAHGPADYAQGLAALVEACPAPLHRWFTAPLHRALAVAVEDLLATGSTVNHEGITAALSSMGHSDVLDHLRGRAVKSQPCAYEDSALANLGGWSAICELQDAGGATVGVAGLARPATRRVSPQL